MTTSSLKDLAREKYPELAKIRLQRRGGKAPAAPTRPTLSEEETIKRALAQREKRNAYMRKYLKAHREKQNELIRTYWLATLAANPRARLLGGARKGK